ncbi:hypothetical protein GCM10009718_19480 [Isoptericola halotolerans]|uniref:Uncharacterized protein n=1 Tax=Isoptericola halotolerans TaxID=300560 RepID=A0ABX2A6M1_9MICO|nr:hypothetical protein [Isoptericola halotolerans]NOV98468.1 hypothetical protein [Isoptericola halotolerans]
MFWWGAGLIVLGVVVAGRAVWTARRAASPGPHGMVIAVGLGLTFWGAVLVVLGAVRS